MTLHPYRYNLYFFVLFINILHYVSCNVYLKAPCPVVKPMPDYDWKRFQGLWYEIGRYPHDWQNKGDCTTVRYYNDNGNDLFNVSYVIDKERVTVGGTTEVRCGKIIHRSPKIPDSESDTEHILPVTVISTDYDHYSVGYECIYNETTQMREDFLWIITREHNPSPDVRMKIYEILNTTSYIDKCKLIYDHLTEDICLI